MRPQHLHNRTDGRRPLVFSWGVSSFFGWGIYGLNLMLHLAEHPAVVPFCAVQFGPRRRGARSAAQPAPGRDGRVFGAAVDRARRGRGRAGGDRPHAAGGHGQRPGCRSRRGWQDPVGPAVDRGGVHWTQATLSPEARQRADRFALIVAGSSWNEQVLRRHGIGPVATVLQGVDTALFHPAPRAGLFPGRFVVFSGGKLEFRKGQDLVLAAFRAFHQRHPEALLVTAWHSPWSELAASAVGHPGIAPPPRAADGTPDVVGWAVANGIPEDAIVSAGLTPNIAMPHVVREADVALFPNRCEGGTNLVAMECLACGIPTILSANTGHLDLLRHGIALPLERQGAPQSAQLRHDRLGRERRGGDAWRRWRRSGATAPRRPRWAAARRGS